MICKSLSRFACAFALAAAVVLICPAPPAHAVLKPKIDNFFFLVDTSGSMGAEYMDTGKSKFELAREIAMKMNPLIPELDYDGALATMAPFEMLQKLRPYSEGGYYQSLSRLPDDVRFWFGNPTPLGEDLLSLKEYLPAKNERTALILFSDGGSNTGRSVLPAAEGIYEEYGGNLCFHVISFAENSRHQKMLDDLAALSDCTLMTSYPVVKNDAALQQFVQDVFYTEVILDSDSDGDGVIDTKDRCPGTPAGVAVDIQGCPLDSDGDGVYDYLDACPGTPKNLAVDARGCPLPVTFNLKMEFDTDKSDIRPQYRDELRDVASFLKEHPNTTAVVEGHTDARGSAAYNQKLSQRRADAVMDYISQEFGVNPARLSAKGRGESQPIADNKTPEGRQENRRVLVIVTGGYQQR